MQTQTTAKGSTISNITYNLTFKRQEGIATLTTGETFPVWRGGYEAWGCGWLPQ